MEKKSVFVVFILLVFLTAGCRCVSEVAVTNNSKTDYLKKIPHLANRIYVTKQGVSADKMCDELLNILVSRNHLTVVVDREKHSIITETKDVGHATLQRMKFDIQDKDNGSELMITTEWKSGSKAVGFAFPVAGFSLQENWAPTQWEKNRLGIAFAESAAVANDFTNSTVTYNTEAADLAWYNRKKESHVELAAY
jgi:hypothetical protein